MLLIATLVCAAVANTGCLILGPTFGWFLGSEGTQLGRKFAWSDGSLMFCDVSLSDLTWTEDRDDRPQIQWQFLGLWLLRVHDAEWSDDPGYLVDIKFLRIPFWMLTPILLCYPTIYWWRGPRRRRRRWRKGLCVACGYDLRGSPTGVCSECGEPN